MKTTGVDDKVAVLCRFRQGNGRAGGSEVDGLRANHDHCIAMCVQSLEGVEQRRARPGKEIVS